MVNPSAESYVQVIPPYNPNMMSSVNSHQLDGGSVHHHPPISESSIHHHTNSIQSSVARPGDVVIQGNIPGGSHYRQEDQVIEEVSRFSGSQT